MPLPNRLTNPGRLLTSEFFGGESDTIREIPPEWRATLDLTVREIPMPWDQPIIPLSDEVLSSKAEQKVTAERIMRTTYKPPGVFYLYESFTDKNKQLGTRTKSFHFIDDWPSVVPNPTALTDVDTRNFGNKHFELKVDSVPTLFTEESFCSERGSVTPPDFRALLEEQEHCEIELGQATAPPDPLPVGVIKWCDNDVDIYTHKVCKTTLDLTSLPQTIHNKETNPRKQFVAVDRTLELDTTTPLVPTALMDVEFTKLGDGTALEIHKTVPEVFDEHLQERTRPVVTPEDFRALLTEHEEDQILTGTSVSDPFPLPTGVIRHSLERVTEFTYKDSIRTIDTSSLPKTNANKETNPRKQVVSVNRMLELDTTVPAVPTALMDVEFTKLGDGTALEIRRTIPEVFDEHLQERSRPVVTPEDFRALLTEHEEDQVLTGTTVFDPFPLPSGVIKHSQERLTEFTYKDSVRTIDTSSLPKTNVNYETNQFKQIVTVNRILELDTTTPAVPTDVTDVTFTKLGDGTALEIDKTVPNVFPQTESAIEFLDIIPPEFKAALPIYTRDYVTSGLINDPPIPMITDLEKSEKQLTEFTKRVHTRGRTGLSFPQVLTNEETTELYGGGVLSVIFTLANSVLTVDTGLLVTESSVRELGTGLWLKQTKQNSVSAWPILLEDAFDNEMQVHKHIERQVVDPTYTPTDGTYFVETLKGIDLWRSERTKTTRQPTAVDVGSALVESEFAPYQFPGTVDVVTATNSDNNIGFRQTRAELVEFTIKTWWVYGAKPTIAYDLIITDSITVGGIGGHAREYHGVLHDAWTTTVIVGGYPIFYATSQHYPATTPSFTEYYLGTPDGTFTTLNVPNLYSPGAGYTIGDSVTFSGDGGSAHVTVTGLGTGGSILSWNVVSASGWTPSPTAWGPYTGSGGSTAAQWTVSAVSAPNYTSGTAWVGSERIVAASVKPTDIPNLWKVQTKSVVMR